MVNYPNIYAQFFLSLLDEYGVDRDTCFKQIGLDEPIDIESEEGIPPIILGKLCIATVTALNEIRLGKEKTEELWDFCSYGLMFVDAVKCRSLREAIQVCCRHYRAFNRYGGSTLELEQQDGLCNLLIAISEEGEIERNILEDDRYFGMNSLNLMTDNVGICVSLMFLHRLLSWVIDEYIELDAINLSYPQDAMNQELLSLFNCPIYYDQPQSSIIFSAHYLSYKPSRCSTTIMGFKDDVVMGVFSIANRRESLSDKVRALIGKDFSHGIASVESVAQQLHLSPVTLYRHLKDEGTSFQRIKDQCRREAAMEYLADSSMSLADVTYMLGFCDCSTFYRAFKKWTDMTPSAYRETMLDDQDQHLLNKAE